MTAPRDNAPDDEDESAVGPHGGPGVEGYFDAEDEVDVPDTAGPVPNPPDPGEVETRERDELDRDDTE